MANVFNGCFCNVGHDSASKITENNADINFSKNIKNSFYIHPCGANEIDKNIASLPVKAGGIDNIKWMPLKVFLN